MPCLYQPARVLLFCATALASAPAWADDATPDQARTIERSIRGFLTDMLGTNVPFGERPVQVMPQGDHFVASVPLAPGKDVTADVRPAEAGRWSFDRLRYPSPAQFTFNVPAGPDGREAHLNYNLKIAEQDGRGTIDPTMATPSVATTSVRGLDVAVDGGDQMSSMSHIGRGTGETTLRPSGNGLVDMLATSALEDYSLSTNTKDGANSVALRVDTGKVTFNTEVSGLSRERAPMVLQAMSKMVTDAMAAAAAKDGPRTPMSTAPARALFAAMDGLATSAKIDESVEKLHVVSGPTTVDLDHFRVGTAFESPSGVSALRMDISMDGLRLPGLPLGPAERFIPSRVSLQPSITGVNTAQLMSAIQAALAEGRPADAGPPAEFTQLVMAGGVQMGLDSFQVDVGTTVMTGMGKVGFTGPGQLGGQGQVTVVNFDALVDQVKTVPQAGQALPALLFVKGIGRNVGDHLVWDITYDGATVLVNGVDVAAMAAGR